MSGNAIDSPFKLAERYIGIGEFAGADKNHPLITWWLSLCELGMDSPDETPWCSAFVNGICWEMRAPRSKSAAARSWLLVGKAIQTHEAEVGWDVVILSRGTTPYQQPASVIKAPGHVGLFAGIDGHGIHVLGGNQGDRVSVALFPLNRVLGIRRLL